MSEHVRRNHYKDEVCQTELIDNIEMLNVEYPCYYCDKSIQNTSEQLSKHREECRESISLSNENNKDFFQPVPVATIQFDPFYQLSFIFPRDVPCYTCSAILKTKHEKWSSKL